MRKWVPYFCLSHKNAKYFVYDIDSKWTYCGIETALMAKFLDVPSCCKVCSNCNKNKRRILRLEFFFEQFLKDHKPTRDNWSSSFWIVASFSFNNSNKTGLLIGPSISAMPSSVELVCLWFISIFSSVTKPVPFVTLPFSFPCAFFGGLAWYGCSCKATKSRRLISITVTFCCFLYALSLSVI